MNLLNRLLEVETVDEILAFGDELLKQKTDRHFNDVARVLKETVEDRFDSYHRMIGRYPVDSQVAKWEERKKRLAMLDLRLELALNPMSDEERVKLTNSLWEREGRVNPMSVGAVLANQ